MIERIEECGCQAHVIYGTERTVIGAVGSGRRNLSEIATQLPIIFREKNSLDDFLDRMQLRAYEQLRKQTGSHSQAARLLRTDRVSLYQRIARAGQRINGNVASGKAG